MIEYLLLAPIAVKAAAEQATSGGSTQIIVAALGAGSVGAVLAAMVTGLFTKRKLGAEATEIITKAASGVVESLNAEIVRVNAAMLAVRTEQTEERARNAAERAEERARHAAERKADRDAFVRQLEARDRVLQLHVSWDVMAVAKLAEHGIELPQPPPLKPPLPDFPSGE